MHHYSRNSAALHYWSAAVSNIRTSMGVSGIHVLKFSAKFPLFTVDLSRWPLAKSTRCSVSLKDRNSLNMTANGRSRDKTCETREDSLLGSTTAITGKKLSGWMGDKFWMCIKNHFSSGIVRPFVWEQHQLLYPAMDLVWLAAEEN